MSFGARLTVVPNDDAVILLAVRSWFTSSDQSHQHGYSACNISIFGFLLSELHFDSLPLSVPFVRSRVSLIDGSSLQFDQYCTVQYRTDFDSEYRHHPLSIALLFYCWSIPGRKGSLTQSWIRLTPDVTGRQRTR